MLWLLVAPPSAAHPLPASPHTQIVSSGPAGVDEEGAESTGEEDKVAASSHPITPALSKRRGDLAQTLRLAWHSDSQFHGAARLEKADFLAKDVQLMGWGGVSFLTPKLILKRF